MVQRLVQPALLLLAVFAVIHLGLQVVQGPQTVVSRWGVFGSSGESSSAENALVGYADPLAAVMQAGPAQAVPAVPPAEALAAFNAGSALQESVADGRVAWYRRGVAGGELLYAVAMLDERVHIELINADGAMPGSDSSGDTIWTDGGRHLQPVVAMANAPYAAREGMELLWAMAFGFHGAERTSNEGSVVINGVVHRVNAGRGSLCITADGRASIGKFDHAQLQHCAQAVGGGPVILWDGRIANPAVRAPEGDYLPFNPLGEDFVQLDWRIKVYSGGYPKTAVCVGDLPSGRSFVVFANSNNLVGVEFARALRDMGCHSALGGDDDTSTQAVWRGQQLWQREQRPVPDALGVYVRQ